MYHFSIRQNNLEPNAFGLDNIELKDGVFGKPLYELTGAEIEDIRNRLILERKRIVLYTVAVPYDRIELYREVFRKAMLLRIEHIKICLCTLADTGEETIQNLRAVLSHAEACGIPILFEPREKHPLFTYEWYGKIRTEWTGIVFDPLEYVKKKENPFLKVLYKNKYRHDVKVLRIHDGLYEGGVPTLPERGNGEIKECTSALLAFGFDGYFSLREYGVDLQEAYRAFLHMLTQM
ncbi:MAG TPA: hypothetical protein DCY74_02415 [Clostridiales bacterium]|jgi:sugar phosphate isomerase/epimerase|nr:hypothetical protein [Clostridiales bacterium]HBE13006.1 hypothetical protein [Clostridiales bacterium]HCG36671.1 hypothetical protein [Clostridiales bacterium]